MSSSYLNLVGFKGHIGLGLYAQGVEIVEGLGGGEEYEAGDQTGQYADGQADKRGRGVSGFMGHDACLNEDVGDNRAADGGAKQDVGNHLDDAEGLQHLHDPAGLRGFFHVFGKEVEFHGETSLCFNRSRRIFWCFDFFPSITASLLLLSYKHIPDTLGICANRGGGYSNARVFIY